MNERDSGAVRLLRDVLLPNVALVGAGAFIVARSYYNSFFGALGVDPASVGLDYSSTLTSSIGFLLYIAIAGVALPAIVIVAARAARFLLSASARGLTGRELIRRTGDDLGPWLPHALRLWIPLAAGVTIVFVGVLFAVRGADYARAVDSGKPVRIGSTAFTSFGVRASPVRLQPNSDSKDTATFRDLLQRSTQQPGLLYLGHSDGQTVLYDPRAHTALFVPDDFMVIELANCERAGTTDLQCAEADS